MPEIIMPSWQDFSEIVGIAKHDLLICTPYYSREGIGRLFDSLAHAPRFRFWTRLSPSDWAAGVADPNELISLLELADEGGSRVELGIHQRLHAKVYAADENVALVGSANLSGGGFGGNFELMVRLRDDEASDALHAIESLCSPSLVGLTVKQLRSWISEAEAVVTKARKQIPDESDTLAPAQASLDRMLGFGTAPKIPAHEPQGQDLERFIDWLKDHTDLPGAQAITAQFENTDGNNRTGHVKQSFYASVRFIAEHPELREHLSSVLNTLSASDIYKMQQDSRVSSTWIEHLDIHATDAGENYSYSTLRTILPPSLGGTRLGGGGGSGTIKRVLPLAARFKTEKSNEY